MAYTADKPALPTPVEELRQRIPGWGVDLDPSVRPSVPRERPDVNGAHWNLPEPQPELLPRERSIEHAALTPVFGTACPMHGASGTIRRLAYRRFSEARAAHWLLLIAADRVDSTGAHMRALVSGRPDNPITQSGIRAEWTHRGTREPGRADRYHRWIDPLLVAGPWLAAAAAPVVVWRRRRTA